MIYAHGDNGVTKTCGNCKHWEGKGQSTRGVCLEMPYILYIKPLPTTDDYVVTTPKTFSCNNHVFDLDKE